MGEGLPSRALEQEAENKSSEILDDEFDLNTYAEGYEQRQKEVEESLREDKEADGLLQTKAEIEIWLRLNVEDLGIKEEQMHYATPIILEEFQATQEMAAVMGFEMSLDDFFKENFKKISKGLNEKIKEVQNEKEVKIKTEIEQFIYKNLSTNSPKDTLHDFFDPTNKETKSLREGLKRVDPTRFEKYQKYLDLLQLDTGQDQKKVEEVVAQGMLDDSVPFEYTVQQLYESPDISGETKKLIAAQYPGIPPPKLDTGSDIKKATKKVEKQKETITENKQKLEKQEAELKTELEKIKEKIDDLEAIPEEDRTPEQNQELAQLKEKQENLEENLEKTKEEQAKADEALSKINTDESGL